tara:strand:- start:35 stop:526 length:492 start_codon:yes stop_codon:yes gene_type:complete
MNLVPIKDYEDLYSFDLNTNQVYNTKYKRYKKPSLMNTGYYYINFYKNNKIKIFQLHRLVYEAHNGTIPEGLCIDHIDCNPKNNNIENLRIANLSENQHNRKVNKNNNTGYKNIRKTKWNTYHVQIKKNNKMVYNKSFKTLEEAILNRDVNLVLIHGAFHNLG